MRMGTRWVAVCAMAAMLSAAAHADEASKREKLHEMFRLAHIDQTISAMFAAQAKQMPRLMEQMMPGRKFTAEQQADLEGFLHQVQDIVQKGASWDKLEPQFTDIYASVYSEQEVDGLVAFYKSPVGQEMVAKQPEIVEKSQAITQTLLRQVQPQIMQAAMEFAQKEQAKSQHDGSQTPAKAPSGAVKP